MRTCEMASSTPNLLLLSVALFPVAVANECYQHETSHEMYKCMYENPSTSTHTVISIVMGVGSFFVLLICCCCCPCCCLYNVCRNPQPVPEVTTTTTVVNTQCVMQQPVPPGPQYPTYQPVPTHPGYGGQPMAAAQYQGQPYAPGPPPPYHTVVGPGYPSTQEMYPVHTPVHPPAQAGYAHVPPPADLFTQPAYNPAYVQSPDTGY